MTMSSAFANRLVRQFLRATRAFFLPRLLDTGEFQRTLGRSKARLGTKNVGYACDEAADGILRRLLRELGFRGAVFSEESGWTHVGRRTDYIVVCDPFDNSFLSSRTFREASAAISVADADGNFLACGIAELSGYRTYFCNREQVLLLDGKLQRQRTAATSSVARIEQAFIVLPSLLKDYRHNSDAYSDLVRRAKYLLNLDGQIMLGRLAAGQVDGYVDTVNGQALYEMCTMELLRCAGATVSDADGQLFSFSELLRDLRRRPHAKYKPVVAATPQLHAAILRSLSATR
jgi:fructose-1,6-bisphosphatase/inositol monophosphatase family enzyme